MASTPARLRNSDRTLTPAEVEAVLGRAIELHVRETARASGEDLSEADLLRIGGELGLPPTSLRRALAEVDGGIGGEQGWLARHIGEPRAGASRIVARPAAQVSSELESYLLDVECMVVERRFPGRTLYVPAKGVVAWATRAGWRLGGRHPLLGAERLEAAVQPLDDDSCCIALTVDLAGKRREHTAIGAIGGSIGGSTVAVLAGTLVAPPLALAGVPVVAAGLYASRHAYRGALADTVERVESLLDRLEHRELRRRTAKALRAFGL